MSLLITEYYLKPNSRVFNLFWSRDPHLIQKHPGYPHH
uniref:Uncharacterized protein n=1 Tax=Anguilla anguilla TaxID=7936 RepID=A0A0E9TPY7_ANGAN